MNDNNLDPSVPVPVCYSTVITTVKQKRQRRRFFTITRCHSHKRFNISRSDAAIRVFVYSWVFNFYRKQPTA